MGFQEKLSFVMGGSLDQGYFDKKKSNFCPENTRGIVVNLRCMIFSLILTHTTFRGGRKQENEQSILNNQVC